MIELKPTIARIEALLEQDTYASVTYAALEARLALERWKVWSGRTVGICCTYGISL